MNRPLFMKTYGKQNRKLEAWISPDNRKKVFASTSSSDLSIAEPSSPKPPAKRGRKRSTADGSRATRPAKTKALSCLREKDSDEENIFIVPLLLPQTQQQSSNTTRKPVLRRAGRKAQRVLSTSESDGETTTTRQQKSKRPKHTTARAKTHTKPSPGRFVTHRRGAVTAKHKAPKRKLSVVLAQLSLNSSDDFVQGGGGGGGGGEVVQRAFPRRRALASADSSLADLGNSGVTNCNGFLQDISQIESSERSLGPCHRKPLFSSTPSSRSLPPPPLLHPSISPSASDIISLSTTQEELDVPEDPLRPSLSASLKEPRTGLSQRSPLGQAMGQPEVGNCEEPTPRGSTSVRSSRSRNGGSEIQDGFCEQLSLELFSVVACEQTVPDRAGEGTDGSSHFVSATVGQDWLAEVVKEKCVTRCCVVRLERVDRMHSDTTYSSCIDHTQSHNSGGSVDHMRSMTSGQSIDHSVISDPSRRHTGSVNDGQSLDHTGSVNDGQSEDHILITDQFDVQILSVNVGLSLDRAVNSVQSLDRTVSISQTSEEPVSLEFRVKQRCLATHCQVQLERLTITQPHRETSLTITQPHRETSLTITQPHREERLTVTQPHREQRLIVTQPHREERLTVTQPHRETSLTVTQPHREERLTVTQPHREERLTVTQPHREERLTVIQPHREERLTVTQPHREVAYSSSSLDHTRSDGDQCLKCDRSIDHNTRSDSGPADYHARSENVPKEKDSLVPKHHVPKDVPNRWKVGGVLKERKRRSVSWERPATSRKVCVSGVSVSRWGRRDGAPNSRAAPPPGRAGDCSITELLSAQHTHQTVSSLSDSIVLGTPVRSNRLHLSSLLVNLTPETHTWSRLKAALSLHRKTKAFLTPKRLPLYLLSSPEAELGAGLGDVSHNLFSTPLRMPLPRHLRSQILGSTPLSVSESDADLSDGQKVYSECGQTGPLGFQDCLPAARVKLCMKIGEGTFGEVFCTTNTAGDTVALKIIPIEGCDQVNGEEQKTFGEILHEIIISKELSSLKDNEHNQTTGFIGLKDLHCVQGCYPPGLLKAWDSFDAQRGSENDRPDFFGEEQLFLILEFEFGGSDLENSNGQLASVMVAKSILHQVTAALAVAEQELCFEHRDLHWGNVLVQSTKEKKGSFLLNGTNYSLETRGVTVRLIDYSLSRLEIDGLTVSCDISEDEELFQGQGDYQFDIYRLMRQENSNMWSDYQPHSNVLWLHYLCSKLLTMTYKSRGGRGLKQARVDLQRFHDNVLTFRSASDLLHNCDLFQ